MRPILWSHSRESSQIIKSNNTGQDATTRVSAFGAIKMSQSYEYYRSIQRVFDIFETAKSLRSDNLTIESDGPDLVSNKYGN